MGDAPTYPSYDNAEHLVIAPTYSDESGVLWVHKDYVKARQEWALEDHIAPPAGHHAFGDVESWVAYAKRYGGSGALLTWNARGFQAVLDHHESGGDGEEVFPGRSQWTASHPFELAPEFRAWQLLATGQPIPHRTAVERLEDRAPDIVDPPATDLMGLLRSLRATVNATASTDLRADGTSSVSFSQEKTLKGGPISVDLPPEFTIAVPVIKGHVDADGKAVLYKLGVRLRLSVADDARLAFRFAMPGAERVLEAVYADRVALARKLLGDGVALLRAADSN